MEHGALPEQVDHLLHLRWIRDSHSVWSDRPTFSVNFPASNLNDIQLQVQPPARAPQSRLGRYAKACRDGDMNAVEASLFRSHARPAKERWKVTDAKACRDIQTCKVFFCGSHGGKANERWNVHDKTQQDLNRKLSMYTVALSVRFFANQSLSVRVFACQSPR